MSVDTVPGQASPGHPHKKSPPNADVANRSECRERDRAQAAFKHVRMPWR